MKKKILLALFVLAFGISALANISVSAESYVGDGQCTFYKSNGEAIVSGCLAPNPGEIVIPEILGGCPVTTIVGSQWGSGFSKYTGITIPNSVTTIGDYAFLRCRDFTDIDIPDNVTYIGKEAFADCYSLTSVTIPDGVTTINKKAFSNCIALTSVTIPNSVSTIGEYIFSGCDSLTSVTIPGSISFLEHGMFNKCENLENVTIQDGVKTIGTAVFYGCKSLASITIPDSITSIGESAFEHSTKLTDVYYSGTKKEWENIVIDAYNEPLKNATIHFMGEPETGDSNGDEVIDIKDVILMRRFITGGQAETIFEGASDVNKDDEVDVRDIVVTRRFVAGGYGVEL